MRRVIVRGHAADRAYQTLYARVIRMRTQEIIMRVGVASGSVS